MYDLFYNQKPIHFKYFFIICRVKSPDIKVETPILLPSKLEEKKRKKIKLKALNLYS